MSASVLFSKVEGLRDCDTVMPGGVGESHLELSREGRTRASNNMISSPSFDSSRQRAQRPS